MKRWWWVMGIVAALGAIAAPAAMAKITVDRGGSGEVSWTREDTCGGHPCLDEDWAVELATYYDDDWAVVWLDVCEKFTVDEISYLSFYYRHLQFNTDCGPRMALSLLLYDSNTNMFVPYLAISNAAGQSGTCDWFQWREWSYSTWDGSQIDSYDLTTQVTGKSLVDLQTALSGADVMAVGVFMGVVGWPTALGLVTTGQAIISKVQIEWNGGSCGGVYDLERDWPIVYDFEDDDQWLCYSPPDEDQWDEWTFSGLWKIVNQAELFGESTAVKAFPSGTHAAYFGNPDPTTGKGSYNGTGSRVSGYLTSPVNYLNPGDQFVDISFKYYRLVEQYKGSYTNQVYDRTWVEIRWFYDACQQSPDWGPWLQKDSNGQWFWYKDSSHTDDLGAWQSVQIPSLEIPCCATKIQFRFVFDSIDGYNNNYLGLLIDDVVKTHACQPSCLEIITDFLPQGTIKVPYGYKGDLNGDGVKDPGECFGWKDLNGNGSVEDDEIYFPLQANKPGVRWELVIGGRNNGVPLPDRLSLEHGSDPTGEGRITGHPDENSAGTYTIVIRATWGDGVGCNDVTRVFTLAIRSPSSGGNVVYKENFDSSTGGGIGWNIGSCPLWHQAFEVFINDTTVAQDPGETDIITPEYAESAYFGTQAVEGNDGKNPNYIGSGGRVKCCLTSPPIPIPVTYAGEEIVLGFKSWREVESYTGGAFDKTWVEVQWSQDSGCASGWRQVWYKDSKDPSERAWTWIEVPTGLIVPQNKTCKLQIRFCFDSVDGYNNNFVGWLVDEVTVYAGSSQLTIVGCPLPEGTVGALYKAKVSASGGPAPTGSTKGIRVTELPPGLEWNPATGEITGIPREAGQWTVHIVATIYDVSMNPIASAEKDCGIKIGEQTVLLFEDFELDPKWTWGSLWHRTSDAGVKGVTNLGPDNHAAYYGKDDTTNPNYNTGDRTTGALTLTSPVIDLTGVPAVKVSFDYWREVESFGGSAYDLTLAQVRIGSGGWTTVWQKDSKTASSKAWITENGIHFLVPAGSTQMLIRFVFDSVDKWYNSTLGWIVDNIRVDKAPTTGAKPLSALAIGPSVVEPRGATISFFNFPNPVRDVHTTTFTVRGVEADRIKVEVYDLAGRLVYTNEVEGSELVWHTQDLTGLPLANGVYLYKVYVQVGETWVVSSVEKLVILR